MKKQPFPLHIETDRLILKQHKELQAEIMFNYIDQDRNRLREFLPWVDFTKTVEDERSYIKMTLKKWEECELFDYGLYRKSDNLYLGNAGVHSLVWNFNQCELGYWILGIFEGQGYMSEAIKAIEQVAFDLGFNRIEIRCSSINIRSASIPKRLNYHLDGTLRENIIENGKYRDTLVFSKLKKEIQK